VHRCRLSRGQSESAGSSSAFVAATPGLCDLHFGLDGYTEGCHRPAGGCTDLAAAQVKQFVLGPESRVLQLASSSFDAAVMEV